MSIRSQLFLGASVVIAGWINFTWLSADEPENHVRKVPPLTAPAQTTETLPVIPPLATDSEATSKDPLYQAIREQLKNGRPSLIPKNQENIVPTQIANKATVTDVEWKAVELMLRAARMLDRARTRSDANNDKADHSATVKQLRTMALHILQEERSE